MIPVLNLQCFLHDDNDNDNDNDDDDDDDNDDDDVFHPGVYPANPYRGGVLPLKQIYSPLENDHYVNIPLSSIRRR